MAMLLSQNTRQTILDLYRGGMGVRTISVTVGCSQSAARYQALKAGILRNWKEAAAVDARRNHTAWGKLNAERAWVLGLLFADGSIDARGSVCSITRDNHDEDILLKAQKIIGGRSRIYQAEGCKRLVVCSKSFNQLLRSEFGLDENKGPQLKWPDLDATLVRHFVRGLLDSDGGWYQCGGRQTHLMKFMFSSIAGEFVEALERAIFAQCPVARRIICRCEKGPAVFAGRERASNCRPIFTLDYSHIDAVTIGEWLYRATNPEVRGQRKYEKWMRFAGVEIKPWALKRHRDRIAHLSLAKSL